MTDTTHTDTIHSDVHSESDTDTDTDTAVWTEIESPLGQLRLARSNLGIIALLLPGGRIAPAGSERWIRDDTAFDDIRIQLGDYFAGRRADFDTVLAPTGTAFQQRVWTALRLVGYGRTATYGEIATMIGAPGAARAVGLANGRNPVSVIVPCHRIIGADGSLTGYGGGLPAKRWLLEHEQLRIRAATAQTGPDATNADLPAPAAQSLKLF